MPGMMVSLRWDGTRLSTRQLAERATRAANRVDREFTHLNQLDIQALANEPGQFVQLVINTDATDSECHKIAAVLKQEFARTTNPSAKPWWKFW